MLTVVLYRPCALMLQEQRCSWSCSRDWGGALIALGTRWAINSSNVFIIWPCFKCHTYPHITILWHFFKKMTSAYTSGLWMSMLFNTMKTWNILQSQMADRPGYYAAMQQLCIIMRMHYHPERSQDSQLTRKQRSGN